jgi:GT2 family glycosyltransferase
MSRGRFRNKRWSELRLQKVEEILLPSACVALYKRPMLEETGFFDDDFFAYAEDSDLGLRGRLAGWEAVAATGAVVYHKYSRTGGILSPFKVYLVERNHYWLVWKNFFFRHHIVLPFYSIWRYCEQVRSILLGGGTGGEFRSSGSRRELIKAQIKGIYDGLGGIPRMLRKRRQLKSSKKLSAREFSVLLRRYRISFRELLDQD